MSLTAAAAFAIAMTNSAPATAQMVDVPIWGNGILGQSALRNTYDNYDRANGLDRNKRSVNSRKTLPRCTEDFVPRADYRRMETQYQQIVVAEGKQYADRWSQQQANAWYRRLQQQGVFR